MLVDPFRADLAVNQPWMLKVSVVVTLWRQAQQRCCGGCEEGDFNVHNLLCVSGNDNSIRLLEIIGPIGTDNALWDKGRACITSENQGRYARYGPKTFITSGKVGRYERFCGREPVISSLPLSSPGPGCPYRSWQDRM